MNPLELPGLARLATGSGGLPRYEITTPEGEAHVYLHGAHVTHFAPAGKRPVLFMSEASRFEPGFPIRGGIPIVFPWFGLREGLPQHGFARTRSWTPESLVHQADGRVALTLSLKPDAETEAIWTEPNRWALSYRVIVGPELALELAIENRGLTPFRCEEALHTYFQVGDVRQIEVRGLENAPYHDKDDGMKPKRRGPDPERFVEAETTHLYMNTTATAEIVDPVERRRIVVEKENCRSTVVWTPMSERAKAISDLGDGEWPFLVCVETGNVFDDTLEIAPGQRHVSRTVLRCEDL